MDLAIDLCELLQNLREIVLDYRLKYEQARVPEESSLYLNQAIYCLERYMHLIIFDSYLSEQAPINFTTKFSCWIKKRPELTSIISDIRKAPAKALKIKSSVSVDISVLKTNDLAGEGSSTLKLRNQEKEESEAVEYETIVRNRKGNVLSKNMIIKADHYNRKSNEFAKETRDSEIIGLNGEVINYRSARGGFDYIHGVAQTTGMLYITYLFGFTSCLMLFLF